MPSSTSSRPSPSQSQPQPSAPWHADELSTSPTSTSRVGLMGLEIGDVGPTGSPLEQLGKYAGTARKDTLGSLSPSDPSSSTLRPNTNPSPLIFNSFRNSTTSLSSTYYTSSIYSNSDDNHAYWEGRRPEDDNDNDGRYSRRFGSDEDNDDDDTQTERGEDDDQDELEEIEDDDQSTDLGHDKSWGSTHEPYAPERIRPDGGSGSADFTTSTRLSRLLLSNDGERGWDPDASFASQWSTPSNRSSDTLASFAPAGRGPDLDPNPSMSGVSPRRAEISRSQATVESVHGQEGNQWEAGAAEAGSSSQAWASSSPVMGRDAGGSSSSSGNFSRPTKSAARSPPVSGRAMNGEFVNPPQRNASLRRRPAADGPGGSPPSRTPSPPTTPRAPPGREESVPFPRHETPSPAPSVSPTFSSRQPATHWATPPSSSSNASTPQDPHFQIHQTYAPPRPHFVTSQSAFGSSSNLSTKSGSSTASLPTRRAPAPPTDVPAFHGGPSPNQPTIRIINPSSGGHPHPTPRRQAHPSNPSHNAWSPTVPPSSAPSSSSKFTPVPPSQRQLTYPAPNHDPTDLSGPAAMRSRTQSASEQGGFVPDPPRPSFTVTSRTRSESNTMTTSSPLSATSSSGSGKAGLYGAPAAAQLRVGTTAGTSRSELHPGLFSFYELGPSSRSSSPTSETFAAAAASKAAGSGLAKSGLKGSYTKVEIVEDHDRPPSPSETVIPEPEEPPIRMGPEQYLKLGIQHHTAHRSSPSDLSLAAMYFKEAATIDGGCPGGMLFWGLSLRSGWGVARDEKKGFYWLRRACEPAPPREASSAGGGAQGGSEAAVLAPEMVVAILEVAQCFLHGWGCGKDPEKAVNYLGVASKMGDMDAQLQLASCYLHGLGNKGKKDKAKSAFWFRAAIDQGASDAGLSWVYKKKYLAVPVSS